MAKTRKKKAKRIIQNSIDSDKYKIIQGARRTDYLIMDLCFWTRLDQDLFKRLHERYRILCPSIFVSEIYEGSGSDKLLKNNPKVFGVNPWEFIVQNELEGNSIEHGLGLFSDNLKPLEKMTGEYEKAIIEHGRSFICKKDAEDIAIFNKKPIRTPPMMEFMSKPYKKMSYTVFADKLISCYEKDAQVFKHFSVVDNREIIKKSIICNRNQIERLLDEMKRQCLFPVNTFEKDGFERAFRVSKEIMSNEDMILDFFETCFIQPLMDFDYQKFTIESNGFEIKEFDKTFWSNNKHRLKENPYLFRYSRYILSLLIAIDIYQMQNTYTKKVQRTDIEYLSYAYFSNVLFVTCDYPLSEYVSQSRILNSRKNGSFVYVPDKKEDNLEEYNKAINFIEHGAIY